MAASPRPSGDDPDQRDRLLPVQRLGMRRLRRAAGRRAALPRGLGAAGGEVVISERSGADVGIPVELTLKGKPEPVAARLVRIAAPGTPGDAGPGWGVVSG